MSGSSRLTRGLSYTSVHHPLAYQCKECDSQHADLSELVAHMEGSACTESVPTSAQGVNRNTRTCILSICCPSSKMMSHLQENDLQDACKAHSVED